jgi:hypothetical protein
VVTVMAVLLGAEPVNVQVSVIVRDLAGAGS